MEKYLSAREVSERLGFRLITLTKWRQKEIGPKFRKLENGRIRYLEADVHNYIQQFGAKGGRRKSLVRVRLNPQYA